MEIRILTGKRTGSVRRAMIYLAGLGSEHEQLVDALETVAELLAQGSTGPGDDRGVELLNELGDALRAEVDQ